MNCTFNGARPEVGIAVKDVFNGDAVTARPSESVPQPFETEAMYSPGAETTSVDPEAPVFHVTEVALVAVSTVVAPGQRNVFPETVTVGGTPTTTSNDAVDEPQELEAVTLTAPGVSTVMEAVVAPVLHT